MPSRLTSAQKRLTSAQTRRRRAALGPTLAQTDDDLTVLAEATPSHLAEIEAFVRAAAGPLGVALLRAERSLD